ncbi:MAG: Acetyl/propionyl-CoA carboxylase, alpha subunit, partial [Modestobacter sp.]|nr:Acetyl/propionyl-CoA carboxylase, alpha subunit [Modestobacter sp.]
SVWKVLVAPGTEVAAGFSLDMAVLERAHGVDAVELALASASGRRPRSTPAAQPWAAVAVQLRSTLPAGTAGRVTGRLPDLPGRPTAPLVAVRGYDPGDRLDGWYDALLATVSAAGPDAATAAQAAGDVLTALPEAGVPHDGAEICATLRRIASALVPGGPDRT